MAINTDPRSAIAYNTTNGTSSSNNNWNTYTTNGNQDWIEDYNDSARKEMEEFFERYINQQQKVTIHKNRILVYKDIDKKNQIDDVNDIEMGGEYYFQHFTNNLTIASLPDLYKFYVADMDVFKDESCIINIFYTRLTNNTYTHKEIDVRAKMYIDYTKENAAKDFPPFYFKQKMYDIIYDPTTYKTNSTSVDTIWIDTSSSGDWIMPPQ